MDQQLIEEMVRKILAEKLDLQKEENTASAGYEVADGIIKVSIPKILVGENDRLNTGNDTHQVYTHDLFSLKESPRLGCGIMEMERSTFSWNLDYDEIDYVIEGKLTILHHGKSVTAEPGEIILIPKGSSIQFSVPEKARFLYVTYPADWNG